MVFSAVPYLASPLTLNHDWLIEHLRRLHVGRLQELGTAIGDAIAMSAKRLKDLLVVTKLVTVFDSFDNEAEAIASFGGAAKA